MTTNLLTVLQEKRAEHKRALDRLDIAIAEAEAAVNGHSAAPPQEIRPGKRAPIGFIREQIKLVVAKKGPMRPVEILHALKPSYPYPMNYRRLTKELATLKKSKELKRTPKGYIVP